MHQTPLAKNANAAHQQMIKNGCAGCGHTASCILFRYMKENQAKKQIQIDGAHSADCKCPECSGERKGAAVESLFGSLEKEKRMIERLETGLVSYEKSLEEKKTTTATTMDTFSFYENKGNFEKVLRYVKTGEEVQRRENWPFPEFEAEIKNEIYFFRENIDRQKPKSKEIALSNDTGKTEMSEIEDSAITEQMKIVQLPITSDEKHEQKAANEHQGTKIEVEKREPQHKTESQAKETFAGLVQRGLHNMQKDKRNFVIGEYTYEDILAIGWLRKLYGHLIGLHDAEMQSNMPKVKMSKHKSQNIKQEHKSQIETEYRAEKKSKENDEELKEKSPPTKPKEVQNHNLKAVGLKDQENESDAGKRKEIEKKENLSTPKISSFSEEQGKMTETKKEGGLANEGKKRKGKRRILELVKGIITKRKIAAARRTAKKLKGKDGR
ncbi:MAG: hypothetical protein QXN37_03850 [Candidatus Anstonellaceae archaeon]